MRYFCLIFIALLTMMSCGDMFDVVNCYYIDVECVNNSKDTVYVSMYGHEMGANSKIVMRLEHTAWPVTPRTSNDNRLALNWDLEPTWENIWYSYGIDTLYVVMSQTQNVEKSFERMDLPKEDDILKTYKFTKDDKALYKNKITIVYP